jgi:hypothetical protein
MRYPLYKKYAMAVDPKVLKHDFESDEKVNSIPEFLQLMRSVDEHTFYTIAEEVNYFVDALWGRIENKIGINLKDREKLLPIFQEYHRISESFSYIPNELYRGVSLPRVYGNILKKTFGNKIGEVDLKKHKEIEKIFEGLAYGLRSWSNEQDTAMGYSFGEGESIIFILIPEERNVVLDGNALIQLIENTEDISEDIPIPVDYNEYIVYLKKPEIVHAYKKDSHWVAIVQES